MNDKMSGSSYGHNANKSQFSPREAGAIPKAMRPPLPIPGKQELQEKSQSSRLRLIQTKPASESLKVDVSWDRLKPSLILPASQFQQPCMFQFALKSLSLKDLTKDRLEGEGIYVVDFSDSLQLDISGKHFSTREAVENFLAKAFDDILEDIYCLRIVQGSKDYNTVLNTTAKDVSLFVKHEKIMLFTGVNSLFMVGERVNVEKVQSELKLQKQEERKILCMKSFYLLKELGIDSYLQEKEVIVELRQQNEYLVIFGSADVVDSAVELIREFSASVIEQKVELREKDHANLLYLESGEKNKNILGYFQTVLKVKKVEGIVDIEMPEEEPCVYFYCLDKEVACKAENIISGCIHSHALDPSNADEIKSLTDEWKEKKKLRFTKRTATFVSFVCSSDVSEKIMKEIDATKDMQLPPLLCTYLATHGKETLNNLASKVNVVWQIDCEKHVLTVRGTKESILKFKQTFKSIYSTDTLQLKCSDSIFHENESALSEIAEVHSCCVKPKYIDQTSQTVFSNCRQVVTWSHVHDQCKVSLIKGQMQEKDTDLRIMFVTDTLFPLHKGSISEIEIQTTASRKHADTNEGPLEVGTVKLYGDQDLGRTFKSRAVVIRRTNRLETGCFDMKKVEASISSILIQSVRENARSVAIPVSFTDNSIPIRKLIKACIQAITELHQAEQELQIFLYCAKEDNEAEVAQMIDDQFQSKTDTGYYREIHEIDVHFKQGIHKIKKEVMINSLEAVKADVIVNTVATDLTLRNGRLSKQILKFAGEDIQEECRREYPSGIKEGQIAVTCPGMLKNQLVKGIFHCALPEFKKANFIKDVKLMVRSCLLEADKRKYKTIAFPAFGTGKLGYPIRDTAKAMFDAVEEYQFGSINSCIKTVMFVLHEKDVDTQSAFCEEEKRREKKGYRRVFQEMGDHPSLITSVGSGDCQVKLSVSTKAYFKQLPSYVVDVHFNVQKGKFPCELKPSSKHPKTERDQLLVYVANRDELLPATMVEIIDYCDLNKVSEISISTKENKMSTAEQIGVIQKAVQDRAKLSKTKKLCVVHIEVSESLNLDDIEKELNSQQSLFMNTIKSIMPSFLFQSWRRNTCEESYVELKIVGKTENVVNVAKEKVLQYMEKWNTDGQKLHKNRNDYKNSSNIKGFSAAESELLQQEDENDIDQVDVVTAELNPGIIKFLQRKHCLESWKEKIHEVYGIDFEKQELDIVVVQGPFKSICSFEEYLEENFPDDPVKQKINDKVKMMKSVKSESEKFETEKHKVQGQSPSLSTMDIELNPDTVEIDPNSCKVKFTSSCEVTNKTPVKMLSNKQFRLGNLEVYLQDSDIREMKTDCIVSPANEFLNPVGLAGEIAKLAGKQFELACETAIRIENSLDIGDCIATTSGNLPCKVVIHARGPRWVHGENQIHLLKLLYDTVFKCLMKAESYQYTSVALPVLSAGIEGFEVELVAQEYLRAINAFESGGNGSFVKEIFIVDISKEKINKMVKIFQDYTHGKSTVQGEQHSSASFTLKACHNLVDVNVSLVPLEAIVTDAVVSTESIIFNGESRIAQTLLRLGDDDYKSAHSKLKKLGKHSIGDVLETHCKGGDLICKYVLHTAAPRRNRLYCQNQEKFRQDIDRTIENVFSKATKLGCQSVALPLIGTSDDEKSLHTPVESCCSFMVQAITKRLKTSPTTLKRIELACIDKAVFQAFCGALEKVSLKKDTEFRM